MECIVNQKKINIPIDKKPFGEGSEGKVYKIKGYEIPEFSRQAKGLPIINLLPIEKDEKILGFIKDNTESANKRKEELKNNIEQYKRFLKEF